MDKYPGSIQVTSPVYKNANNEPIAPPKDRKNVLNMDSFLQLLAAQISHQDPLNPHSNEDYMAQMAQMTMVQAMGDMMQMSMTTYASSMVGKTVTVADVTSGKINPVEGVVTGVSIYNGQPILHVNGKDFTLDKLMVIGKMPEETKPEGGGGTDKPEGNTDKPEAPEGGTNKPEAPEGGTNKPEAPEGGTNKPEAPEGGTNKPEAPEGGTNKPEAPEGGTNKPEGARV